MLVPIFFAFFFFLMLERLLPDQTLPEVRGWWGRVLMLNGVQLGVVFIAGVTWDGVFQRWSLLDLSHWPVAWAASIGYLGTTFIYYWWHRLRHDVRFVWNLTHQVHHSPARIEVVTSFYKHPVEIVCNALLSSGISYMLFGLSIEAAVWVTVVSAIAEFFYHMNVKTPQWIGYFIQRPEMHRIHHRRGRHYNNFADLPVWDLLFGTFENPPTYKGKCGYRPAEEAAIAEMLRFKNVIGKFNP